MSLGSNGLLSNTYYPTIGVLDQVGPAAAAYSLRKLRQQYTGSAIRVRRSSDNSEQDIGFDVDGNLNVSVLSTFVGASNGFVAIWYDQSGNANNAVQATQSQQPFIVAAGVLVTSGGRAGIRYNGTSTMNLTALGPPVANANNIIVNIVYQEISRKDSTTFSLNPDPDRVQVHTPWADGTVYFDVGGYFGTTRISVASPVALGDTAIYSLYNTTDTSQKGIVIDGNTMVTGSSTLSGVDRLEIGKSDPTQTPDAVYSEFIVIDNRIYTAIFKILERNQGHYYNVTVS